MKKIILILSLCISSILCVSCGKQEVVFLDDAVLMDSQNESTGQFFFCFNYLYRGDNPKIELTEINNGDLEGITYTCEDVTTDFGEHENNKKYDVGALCVEITYDSSVTGDVITITDMTFNVDDEEKEVHLKYPLTYTLYESDENVELISARQTLQGAYFNSDVTYVYQAEKDITIDNISIGEYVTLNDITVSVISDSENSDDEEELGGVESFPVELKKGERIQISGTLDSEYATGYQNVYTTTVLTYTYKGTSYEKHNSLFVESIDDIEKVDTAISSMLDYIK